VVAVDRFAREIVRILKPSCAARSRQLNASPFGGLSNQISGIVVRVGYTPFPLILFIRY
jgi:hypothetical protein